MRRSEIPESITITAPAVYAGTYKTTSNWNSELYVWYFVGPNKDDMPHFTVGSKDDAPPRGGTESRWFRFHVTIGFMSNGAMANGHIFYTFDGNGVVSRKYTNADDLASGPKGTFEALIKSPNGLVYDQLAKAFAAAAGVRLVTRRGGRRKKA